VNRLETQILIDELSKVEIGQLDLFHLGQFYKKTFGVDMGTCGSCREDAVMNLKKWLAKEKQSTAPTTKYKFKEEHKHTQVVLRIDGNRVIIDQFNLTDKNAERILAQPKMAGLLEDNPDYGKKKAELKTGFNPPKLGATISTSTEQPKEDKPLKKRGRKPKLV